MSFPKFRVLDQDSKLASDFAAGDKVVGLNAQIQEVFGVHRVLVSETRRLFRINGFLALGDQMLWTEQGWGVISPAQYHFYRALRFERIESLNMFMEAVIDWQKLRKLEVGDSLMLSDGSTEPISEIVDVTEQYLNTEFSYLITDSTQSVEWESGHISESFLGAFHPESKVMDVV